jgi:hypothetical protein
VYENDAGKWKIPAYCQGVQYQDRISSVQTIELTFECPSPFWLSYERQSILLAYVEGGINFPLKTPNNFGLLGYQVLADNQSDALTPLELYIEGGAINPVITNKTTGKFIKVEKYIQTHEMIYINTSEESTSVILHSVDPVTSEPTTENAYGYLSFDSDLFGLVPGVNDIRFESDDDNKSVRIRGYYNYRFGGV